MGGPLVLLAIVAGLGALDAAWIGTAHFDIDWSAYGAGASIAALCAGAGLFYALWRRDPRLAAMLFATAFLVAFSGLASITNYLLLTIAGRPVDGALAAADRALGFDWPAAIAWAGAHPVLNRILLFAYGSGLPEIALLIPLLGWRETPATLYAFCFALAAATIVTLGIWTLFPSIGAIAVYHLPPALLAHTPLALGPDYARALQHLLADGPGFISPANVKGLIGFPSFHAVLAVLPLWSVRRLRAVRLPLALFNLLMLAATPIQGGHHLVDVLGGIAVAVFAMAAGEWAIARLARAATSARPRGAAWIYS